MRLVLWLCIIQLLTPVPPPQFTLTLLDASSAPVPGVTVLVRDAQGQRELARAITDVQGLATVARLPVNEVRVLVQGAMPSGTALVLPGSDREGIRIYLVGTPTTKLQWRVQADGMVTPDPLTEIAGAEIPAADVPTPALVPTTLAAIAPLPAQTTSSLVVADGGAAVPASAPLVEPNQTPAWGGYLLMALLIVGVGGLLLLKRRGW